MPYNYEDTDGPEFEGPLSPWEQQFAEERLRRLNADPIRFEHGDPQAAQYVDAQWQRTYANGDRPQRLEFDRFTPSADASDLALMAPVGQGGANSPMDVYKAKKVLHNAAAHEFRPGDEGFGEANARLATDIARFQRIEDLKVDGRIDPGGPTLHALAARAPGLAGARPPMLDAADFQDRTGRDPNRTLSGRTIIAEGRSLVPDAVPVMEVGFNVPGSGQIKDGPRAKQLPLQPRDDDQSFGAEKGRPRLQYDETSKGQRDKISDWVQAIKNRHLPGAQPAPLSRGGYLSIEAAKAISDRKVLPEEYRKYLEAEFKAGGERAAAAMVFVHRLREFDPSVARQAGIDAYAGSVELLVSARRWGFRKDDIERLGPMRVYGFVSVLNRFYGRWNDPDWIMFEAQLRQKLFGRDIIRSTENGQLFYRLTERIKHGKFGGHPGDFQVEPDGRIVARLWQQGWLQTYYAGWKHAVTEKIDQIKRMPGWDGVDSASAILSVIGLTHIVTSIGAALLQAAVSQGAKSMLRRDLREWNRREKDELERDALQSAIEQRFVAQLKIDKPAFFSK